VKRWKRAVIAGVLAGAALLSISPVASRAAIFIEEFESSSRASNRVSLVERVVYSLIQAERGARRAPLQEQASSQSQM
jgi:hypothetical protein